MSAGDLYYGDYLQLDKLLTAQRLESAERGEVAHDEMLFIVVHQAYELWFKQILWELDEVLTTFDAEHIREVDIARAVRHLERIVEIQKLLIQQIDVLETMTPLDFLDFRDFLIPASGFQSLQFRLVENKLGMRPDDRVPYSKTRYSMRLSEEDRKVVEASETQRSIFQLVESWLERTPFLQFGEFNFWDVYREAVDTMLASDMEIVRNNELLSTEEKNVHLATLERSAKRFEALFSDGAYAELVDEGAVRLSRKAVMAALLINLYRDQPILHFPYRLLALLVDIDEQFSNWRYRHALMVMRMIGSKVGTGGSSGHDYLRRVAIKHRIFSDLSELSSYFIRRADLPTLPDEVARNMGFSF